MNEAGHNLPTVVLDRVATGVLLLGGELYPAIAGRAPSSLEATDQMIRRQGLVLW